MPHILADPWPQVWNLPSSTPIVASTKKFSEIPLETRPYIKCHYELTDCPRPASSRRGWSLLRRVGLSIGELCPLKETGTIEGDDGHGMICLGSLIYSAIVGITDPVNDGEFSSTNYIETIAFLRRATHCSLALVSHAHVFEHR